MKAKNLKQGDYIYYYNGEGDTIPAVVERVMRVWIWINLGSEKLRVKASSCELQANVK